MRPLGSSATADNRSFAAAEGGAGTPHSALVVIAVAVGVVLLFAGFIALGTWQLERRAWKLDLIARVERRVHAAPAMAPPIAQWSRLSAAADEYRHIQAAGTFLYDSETLVQATTRLGSGFWVLTPLRLTDGSIVLVNRGFVPPEWRDRAMRTPGEAAKAVAVTGLLRMTEPGGGFLRRNNVAENRWYSRDTEAIGAARGLRLVAPYFVDAEAAPRLVDGAIDERTGGSSGKLASRSSAGLTGVFSSGSDEAPLGGLTVIAFHNSHLVYAVTWYTLGLMVAGAGGLFVQEERRLRR